MMDWLKEKWVKYNGARIFTTEFWVDFILLKYPRHKRRVNKRKKELIKQGVPEKIALIMALKEEAEEEYNEGPENWG